MTAPPGRADGQAYAPAGRPAPVCRPGEFVIAAASLDHGHIYGQCGGLQEAGASVKWVYDPDPARVESFRKTFPTARPARQLDEILDDPDVQLVAGAAVPSERAALGFRVMEAGKDYFTDKSPFTTLAQLEEARRVVQRTGRKYAVYYSERIHNESAMHAGDLVAGGAIGRVLQVIGLGPHRLGPPGGRPDWFYDKARYGGILCDIGSHQCEQFLFYAGARDGRVQFARAANLGHPEFPGLEDFGEASITGNNGASFYFRVDWFTPAGLSTWGDGRTFILGADGFIELRKYVDLATGRGGDQVYLVNGDGERHIDARGQVGYRFFGELIRDCLERTERAMTQAHAFKAAELCLRAQAAADAQNAGFTQNSPSH
jgi:predicted dehydrogenase